MPLSRDKRLRGMAFHSCWKRSATGLQQPGGKCQGKYHSDSKNKSRKEDRVTQQMLCFPRAEEKSPLPVHNIYSGNMLTSVSIRGGYQKCYISCDAKANLEIRERTYEAVESSKKIEKVWLRYHFYHLPTRSSDYASCIVPSEQTRDKGREAGGRTVHWPFWVITRTTHSV